MKDRDSKILAQMAADLSRSSEHTRKERLYYAKMFLEYADDTPFSSWNRVLVDAFMRHLERADYAAQTIRKIYGIVKRVFDAAKVYHEADKKQRRREVDTSDPARALMERDKIDEEDSPVWDMGKRDAPRFDAKDVVNPDFTLGEVEAMIKAVRDDPLYAPYLAIASIYGLRRGELAALSRQSFDFKKKLFYVDAEKGSQKRWQLLADGIIPLLERSSLDGPVKPDLMTNYFYRICYMSKIEHQEGAGWHSFRRTVNTALKPLIAPVDIKIFMRWQLARSADMSERYYTADPMDIDAKVLDLHPIVKLWQPEPAIQVWEEKK
ncbi:MAG: site-specific integrase [Synergistaceae bacterium]|jgi:integrase|nr:site-specific integrase [Synergistaceae bacterium]